MKKIEALSRISGMVAMGVLLLMMLLTVADVFLRAVFNRPIIGATEITEQMMVAVAFLGFGWCALQDRQIRVDLFVARYQPGTRRRVDIGVILVSMVLVGVICWRTLLTTLRVHQLGITCAFIGIPKYPFYAVAACGWAVLLLAMACLLIKNIKERVQA